MIVIKKYNDVWDIPSIKKTFWKHILFKRIVCVFYLSKKIGKILIKQKIKIIRRKNFGIF